MAVKVVTFEYELEHRLDISVKDGVVTFDESAQEIYLTKMSAKPAVEIDRVEIMASYPEGAEKAIAEAVGKIINTGAKAVPAKEPTRVGGVMRSAGEIAPGAKGVNEAAVPDMNVQVITEMLDIPVQMNIGGASFKIVTRSADMAQFITFTQSKKIKIFINGKEFAPKQELEFVKRVFPQLDMTVYVK